MTRVTSDIGRYCMVPKWVATRLVGQDEALTLWVWLAILANDDDHTITRSRTHLAKAAGVSVSSFDRRVERLEEAHVLGVKSDVDGPIRRPSTYHVVMIEPPVQSTLISDGAPTSERTPRSDVQETQPLDLGVPSSEVPSAPEVLKGANAPSSQIKDPMAEILLAPDSTAQYLISRMSEAWQKALSPPVLIRCGKDFGAAAVLDALRNIREDDPVPKRAYPYLTAICRRLAEGAA